MLDKNNRDCNKSVTETKSNSQCLLDSNKQKKTKDFTMHSAY
jgi:hypothetical protein